MSSSPVFATLFDFDGVLVDSEPVHLAAFNDVLGAAQHQAVRPTSTSSATSASTTPASSARSSTARASRSTRSRSARSSRPRRRCSSTASPPPSASSRVRASSSKRRAGAGARRHRVGGAPGRGGGRGCRRWACATRSPSSSRRATPPRASPIRRRTARGLAALAKLGHAGGVVAIEDSVGRRRLGDGRGRAVRRRGALLPARAAGAQPARPPWATRSTRSTMPCWRATRCPVALPGRSPHARGPARPRPPGADAWRDAEVGGVRGITVGPIENGYHPGVGYGSPAYERTLGEARCERARPGSPSRRSAAVGSLAGMGVDLTFEAPFAENRVDVARAIERPTRAACASCSCRTSGSSPGSGARSSTRRRTTAGRAGRRATSASCSRGPRSPRRGRRHVLRRRRAALLGDRPRAPRASRAWSRACAASTTACSRTPRTGTTSTAPWSSATSTSSASTRSTRWPTTPAPPRRAARGRRAGARARSTRSPRRWRKPVLFTEIGYTTRPDPAVRPWEWPDAMTHVVVDEAAQAAAYRALARPAARRARLRGLLRVARLRGPGRHLAGGAVGVLAARQAGRARRCGTRSRARWACDAPALVPFTGHPP